jgi:hypothetical protein
MQLFRILSSVVLRVIPLKIMSANEFKFYSLPDLDQCGDGPRISTANHARA